jgi:hypothetical protein
MHMAHRGEITACLMTFTPIRECHALPNHHSLQTVRAIAIATGYVNSAARIFRHSYTSEAEIEGRVHEIFSG